VALYRDLHTHPHLQDWRTPPSFKTPRRDTPAKARSSMTAPVKPGRGGPYQRAHQEPQEPNSAWFSTPLSEKRSPFRRVTSHPSDTSRTSSITVTLEERRPTRTPTPDRREGEGDLARPAARTGERPLGASRTPGSPEPGAGANGAGNEIDRPEAGVYPRPGSPTARPERSEGPLQWCEQLLEDAPGGAR